MALIIEDGTGVVDANSYVTLEQLATYATARGVELPATEPEQEVLLYNAIAYMESLAYKGFRYTAEQSLSWPREGVIIDGWLYGSEDLPRNLLQAQMVLAVDSMTVDLLPTIVPDSVGAVVEKTVVGAVTVKYANPRSSDSGGSGTTAGGVQLARAQALLRPLLASQGAQVPVGRA